MGSTTAAGSGRRAAVAAGLAGLALVAACGSGGGTPVPPASTTPAATTPAATAPASSALCRDAAALKAALGTLTSVRVGPGSGSAISADLARIRSAVDRLAAGAKGQWSAQVSSLKSALNTLQAAVGKLTAQPGAAAVSGVVGAVGVVASAGSRLLASLDTRCPAASPAPASG